MLEPLEFLRSRSASTSAEERPVASLQCVASLVPITLSSKRKPVLGRAACPYLMLNRSQFKNNLNEALNCTIPPKHSKSIPKAPPKQSQSTPEALPKHSKSIPKPFQEHSQSSPKAFQSTPNAVPKQSSTGKRPAQRSEKHACGSECW